MKYEIEVRKDLVVVMIILAVFGLGLAALKLYDAKTNEVGKIGEFIMTRFVN